MIEAVNWEAGHPVSYFWIRKGVCAMVFKVQDLDRASGSATGSLWSQASPLTWHSLSSHESGVKLVFTTFTEPTEISRLMVIKIYSFYYLSFLKQEEIFWNVYLSIWYLWAEGLKCLCPALLLRNDCVRICVFLSTIWYCICGRCLHICIIWDFFQMKKCA